eukprot:6203010-Pleurochrysis_carterae.AAC.1
MVQARKAAVGRPDSAFRTRSSNLKSSCKAASRWWTASYERGLLCCRARSEARSGRNFAWTLLARALLSTPRI